MNQHFKLNVHHISQSPTAECLYNNYRALISSSATVLSLCAVNYIELQWWGISTSDENAESQKIVGSNQKNLQQWDVFITIFI